MTQVALVTHDIERLTGFYEKIMAFAPYRKGDYVDHPRMMEIADEPAMSLMASWFRMNKRSKTIELWEYRVPSDRGIYRQARSYRFWVFLLYRGWRYPG